MTVIFYIILGCQITVDFELAIYTNVVRWRMQFCCVELHYSKISKSELISMGHELANSFLLFRVHKCFLKMIKNLSWRHRLHFFVSIVLWFTIPEYFVLHVKGSVVMFEGRHMFGQFCLVSSVCMLEGWQVVFVPLVEISG